MYVAPSSDLDRTGLNILLADEKNKLRKIDGCTFIHSDIWKDIQD